MMSAFNKGAVTRAKFSSPTTTLRTSSVGNWPMSLTRSTEIDPFTFFGSFNRGVVTDTRIRILEAMKSRFGVGAAVPSSFSGIPTLNNQKSWFFSYQAKRKPGDVDRLWEVFDKALGDEPL